MNILKNPHFLPDNSENSSSVISNFWNCPLGFFGLGERCFFELFAFIIDAYCYPIFEGVILGVIHKPCGHCRESGGLPMSVLLHKAYLVKYSTKGRGGGVKMSKKLSTWFMNDPLWKSSAIVQTSTARWQKRGPLGP